MIRPNLKVMVLHGNPTSNVLCLSLALSLSLSQQPYIIEPVWPREVKDWTWNVFQLFFLIKHTSACPCESRLRLAAIGKNSKLRVPASRRARRDGIQLVRVHLADVIEDVVVRVRLVEETLPRVHLVELLAHPSA